MKLTKCGCCLMLCVALLLLCGYAYAECAAGGHVFLSDADNDYEPELVEYNAEGEVWRVYERQTCALCGATRKIQVAGIADEFRSHNMEYDKDEGHGTTMHAYRYSCTVCRWSEVRYVECSGPPCVNAMQKVPVEDENEQCDMIEQEVTQ